MIKKDQQIKPILMNILQVNINKKYWEWPQLDKGTQV